MNKSKEEDIKWLYFFYQNECGNQLSERIPVPQSATDEELEELYKEWLHEKGEW